MLDFIVGGFIIGSAVSAYRRGFIKTVYKLVSWIVSVCFAFMFYPVARDILKITPFYTIVKNTVTAAVSTSSIGEGIQSQAEAIREMTKMLPEFIGEGIIRNNNPAVYEMMGVSNVIEYIGTYVADMIITVVAFMGVWLIAKLVFGMFTPILDWLSRLGGISFFNRWTGFLFGGVKGVITIWVIALAVPLIAIIPSLRFMMVHINESTLTYFLYNNNLILQYLSRVMVG